MKTFAYAVLTAGLAAGITVGTGGAAVAAHCAGTYSDHVKATNGSGAHNEGDHRGYSTCNESSANYTP